ncbi:MAG: HNH endonuclease, partial [Myxococcaceae bacterium]
ELLALAAKKSRRQLEELIARLEPRPPVPDTIRKLPQRAAPAPVPVPVAATTGELPSPPPAAQPLVSLALATVPAPAPRPSVQPLSADTYKIQFTASRPLKDKVLQARDLLRHQVRDGDLATIVEHALDLLIAKVKKERFGVGVKPRIQARASQAEGAGSEVEAKSRVLARAPQAEDTGLGVGAKLGKQPRAPRAGSCRPLSRHIPVVIRRAVYERDGDRCTYVSEDGRRCEATGDLEFDHLEGFARTHVHAVDSLALRCRAHNAFAAEQMYGRQFMEEARRSIRPGADRSDLLL